MSDWIELPGGEFLNLNMVAAVLSFDLTENPITENTIEVLAAAPTQVGWHRLKFGGETAKFIRNELRLRRINRTQMGEVL